MAKLERLFVERGHLRDMRSMDVNAIPLSVDMIVWNGKGPLEHAARARAPPGADSYACGPFRELGSPTLSGVGVIYFRKTPD